LILMTANELLEVNEDYQDVIDRVINELIDGGSWS
jgi:hypothetical protein